MASWQETYEKLKKKKQTTDLLGGGGDLAPIKTTLKSSSYSNTSSSSKKSTTSTKKKDVAPITKTTSTTSALKDKADRLHKELSSIDREEKVKWWDKDDNVLENVGNVFYKLFLETGDKKYKNNKEYDAKLKEYEAAKDAYQSSLVADKKYSDGAMGFIEKFDDVAIGNIKSGVQGISSTIGKILGQESNVGLSMEEKLAQKALQESSGAEKVALDITSGITRQIPNMLTGSGAVNTALAFANFGGGAYNEAKRMGVDEDKATAYGTTIGGLELALNKILPSYKIGGKNVFGKTATDTLLNKTMGKIVGNTFLRETLTSGMGEFTEEYLQEFLDPIIRETLLEEDNGVGILDEKNAGEIAKNIASYTAKNFFSGENLYAGALGFATSGLLGAPSNYSAYQYEKTTGRNFETGLTQNEQTVLDSVTSQRTTEIQKQRALETEINNQIKEFESTFGTMSEAEKNSLKNRVQEQLDSGELDYTTSKLTKKEITKIEEEVRKDLEKGNLDIDTIESTLSSEKVAQIKELEEELTNTKDNTKKAEIQAKINELQIAKATELQGLLENDTYLQNSYREANLKNEQFTYEAKDTDSEFRKSLANDFSKAANNTTKSHDLFETISKIAEDKQTSYGVVNNAQLKQLGYDVEGKTVNGLVRVNEDGTQKVLINIDSEKAINRILGHETTHLLEGTKEYTELQEMVKQYATTKGEYNTRYKAVQQLYEGTNADIDNEVTADLVGDYLFTDTDFVNNLSVQKPTIFQKIYDEVKHLYNLATAGSKEARDLERVKKAFDKAYKENVKGTETDTKYSISDKNIKEVSTGYSSDEYYYEMQYIQDGKVVGTLEYGDYNGEPNVKMIEVDPEYQRKGIGTKLLQELQNKYKDVEIDFGMTTPDGTKLLEKATYTIDNTEVINKQNRINEISKILDEYDKTFNDYHENGTPFPENYAEDYNELYDERYRLEEEIRGKSATKTFVKTDNVKYSLTDNQGRTLTKEQQEFFKDSKVRDENGNLLTMYHGTNNEFTIFDDNFIGKNTNNEGIFGKGFYFTHC